MTNGFLTSDAFYLREVFIEDGAFDNEVFGDNELFGVYNSLDFSSANHIKSLDFYYAGLDRPASTYQDLIGQDERHTVGLRFLYQSQGSQGYDVDAEVNYQFGDFDDQDIRAYSLSLNADYFWTVSKDIEHRLGVKANIFSGDDNATDNRQGTFNPIYPALGYLSRSALLNFSNLYSLHPSYRLTLPHGFAVNIENAWLWRQSNEDVIYNAAGLPFSSNVTGEDPQDAYVGMLPSIEAEWAPNAFMSFELFYSALFNGDYFSANEEDIHNVVFTTYLRF